MAGTTLDPKAVGQLLGVERVAAATPADAVDGVQPRFIVEPASIEEAAGVVAWANENGLRVAPRGGGSRMGWGNVPDGLDLVLSTRRLNALVEHAAGDMTATVQCGITLQALQERLAKGGQTLALDVPFAESATIGGLIATNDSGPLRLRYGGIRDQLLGVTLVQADGRIVKGGGKVVKNVAGYDLPKLLTGSLGTLALIVQATFRLYPLPAESRGLFVQALGVEQAGALILGLLDSTLMPTGLAVSWSLESDCGLYLRLSGIAPSVEAQLEQAQSLAVDVHCSARVLDAGAAAAAWIELGAGPWSGAEPAVVAKCSVLPADIPTLIHSIANTAARASLRASAVVQAHGLGLIRLEAHDVTASDSAFVEALDELRAGLAARDGTLVLLSAPLGVKRQVDVWGPGGDAVPVMRRIKAQFDPKGTLNPGRFVGRI